MSDNEQSYYMSSDSYDSDASDASDASGESFTSLAADLATLSRHLADLGVGMEDMVSSVQSMEAPLSRVAVSTFVQPRILESAPFRQQKFRWRPEAAAALGVDTDVNTFAEICAHIRSNRGHVTALLGLKTDATILDVLKHLNQLVF